jgi:hypothetical protein
MPTPQGGVPSGLRVQAQIMGLMPRFADEAGTVVETTVDPGLARREYRLPDFQKLRRVTIGREELVAGESRE